MNKRNAQALLQKNPRGELSPADIAVRFDALFSLHDIDGKTPDAYQKLCLAMAREYIRGFQVQARGGRPPKYTALDRLLVILDFARLAVEFPELTPHAKYERLAEDPYWKDKGLNFNKIKDIFYRYENEDSLAEEIGKAFHQEFKSSNEKLTEKDHSKIRQILNLK